MAKGKFTSGPAMTSPVIRVSYAFVFEPRSQNEGGTKKYTMTLMLEKGNPEHEAFLKKYVASMEDVLVKHWPNADTRPEYPLVGDTFSAVKDGDTTRNKKGSLLSKADPYYAGHYLIRATNTKKPRVVQLINGKLHNIVDSEKIYGGCWCQVSINCYAFETGGNEGITNGLNGVLFVKDDDAFGGGMASAEEMFGAEMADASDPFAGGSSSAASEDEMLF